MSGQRMQKIKVGKTPPCGGGNYSNLTLNEGTEGLYPHSRFWISLYQNSSQLNV